MSMRKDVTHSEPKGTFDRTTLAALKRWKYKPLSEDGESDRKDVPVTFYFNLEGRVGYDCPLGY